MKIFSSYATLLATVLCLAASPARGAAGYAIVKKVVGTVTYTGVTGSGAVTAGSALPGGSVITTGANSYADLDLGANGDALRIEADSRVTLDTLTLTRRGSRVSQAQTELSVQRGSVVANVVRKLSRSSRYRIHTPNGIAGIRGTSFRIGVNNTTVVEGTISFTRTTGGGVQTISAGQTLVGSQIQSAGDIQSVANVAIQCTAHTQTAQAVADSVTKFASAIAQNAASTAAGAGQSASDSASASAEAAVNALVGALQSAAGSAPADIQAQVAAAVQIVATRVATITAIAAANGAANAVLGTGGTKAEAEAAASSAAQKSGATPEQASEIADLSINPPAQQPADGGTQPGNPTNSDSSSQNDNNSTVSPVAP